jgi:hypothetical protein
MSEFISVDSDIKPAIGERVRVKFMVGKKAPFVMEGIGVWDGKNWSRLYPVIEWAPIPKPSINQD